MSDDAIIDKERCNNKCDCDGALRRQWEVRSELASL